MLNTVRKTALTVAGLAALALGGAAISGAADNGTRSRGRSARPPQPGALERRRRQGEGGRTRSVPGATVLRTEAGGPYSTRYHAHIRTPAGRGGRLVNGASRQRRSRPTAAPASGRAAGPGPGGPGPGETALTGDTKQQVEDAVKAKYPGATIVRTETNGDSAAPYESHIKTSSGKELEVLVSKDFKVLDAREHPAHP